MYGRTGRLEATPGHRDRLSGILLEAARTVATLDGSVHYVVGIDGDDVVVTEVWESEAHHLASLQSAEVRSLITRATPFIAGIGDGSSYEVLGGLGIGMPATE